MDKIICVGKNYLKHAKELGDAVPDEPIYFLKPPSTIVNVTQSNQILHLPSQGEIHHELELVFKLDENLQLHDYTLGLDLTRRDLQQKLKKLGYPWEKAKVFRGSSVLGPWRKIKDLKTLMEQPFQLSINGQVRQLGYGRDMQWSPMDTLNDLSNWFPLHPGDLLFTGTPEGVGPLMHGDCLKIDGPDVQFTARIDRDG